MDKDKKRIDFIDVAKGISIICIIIGHLSINEINRFVFTFHVPIFFLITGWFIKAETPDKKFIKKKVTSLLLPYEVTCIALIVINAALILIFYTLFLSFEQYSFLPQNILLTGLI